MKTMNIDMINTIREELRWLFLAIVLSFSAWFVLSILSDQSLIVDSHRYSRELYGFGITIGFIYLLRASRKWVNLSW